jgi:hypothetical protein
MKLRIEVQELDTPRKVVFNKILQSYGAGCFPQETEDIGEFYKVLIGVHFPSSVIDQKTNTERIFTFHFNNVGEFLVKKRSLKIESRPSASSILNSIREKRKDVRDKVEKDLIKIIGNPKLGVRFDVLKYAQLGVQPIYRTITKLLETRGKYPLRSEVESIGYTDLVRLIVDIGYVEYNEEQRLTPTNKLKDLFTQSHGDALRTAESIIGLVLAEHYDYLYQTKRIIHFVPYVRASTAYYTEALQFGGLIHLTETRLLESVQKYYKVAAHPSRKARFGHATLIRELLDANILCSEDNFITGRADILDGLMHIRAGMPMSEPPYSSTAE